MILRLRALQHVEFHIARHLRQTRLPAAPLGLEGLLETGNDAETVHGNIHLVFLCWRLGILDQIGGIGNGAFTWRADSDTRRP
ncbi:hypothetical protein D3C72_2487890 [compost metagenome]